MLNLFKKLLITQIKRLGYPTTTPTFLAHSIAKEYFEISKGACLVKIQRSVMLAVDIAIAERIIGQYFLRFQTYSYFLGLTPASSVTPLTDRKSAGSLQAERAVCLHVSLHNSLSYLKV